MSSKMVCSEILKLAVVLLTLISFKSVSSVRDRSISSSDGSCHDANQIFKSKGFGQSLTIPLSQINGDELSICKSKQSCCSADIEKQLQKSVDKEFSDIMRAATSHIKNMIGTDNAKFQESFMDMVRLSENNTLALFAGVYESMVSRTRQPIRTLYSSMRSYLHGRSNVDLEESVAQFFDDIFPSVYHKMINPGVLDLPDELTNCLKRSRNHIKPFGEIPLKISEHVKKSFKTAHILLQALNLGIEVINTTDHSAIYEECSRHLTKLVYCPHCQLGLVGAKPCHGYCLNVVRGCLASIAELDQPWNDYITAMTSMTSQMKGMFSIEEALAMLDDRISEGIEHAVDNGPHINSQVELLCKEKPSPKDEPNNSNGHSMTKRSSNEESPMLLSNVKVRPGRSLGGSLFNKVESFMKALSKSKNFYATLADDICSDDSLAVKSRQNNCWNGHQMGEYNKIQVGIGLEAQKYNPELKYQRFTDLTMARLKDKLIHIRKTLHSQIVTKPESDSFTVSTGSGNFYYNSWSLEDDEDYSFFSSGSGDNKGLGFDETSSEETTHTTPKVTKGGNSSSASSITAFTIMSIISVFIACCNG